MNRGDWNDIRAHVIVRDNFTCCYCNKLLAIEDITMEHIIPQSKGGKRNKQNLITCCAPCNNARANKPFFKYCDELGMATDKVIRYADMYLTSLKMHVLYKAIGLVKESRLNSTSPAEFIELAVDKTGISVSLEEFQALGKSITPHFYEKFTCKLRMPFVKKYYITLIKILEGDDHWLHKTKLEIRSRESYNEAAAQ